MATKGHFTTLANKLKKITGVEPQSFANDIKGFIVILVNDRSKSKSSISAKFTVLIRRRKNEDGTDLITDDMTLATLQAIIDPKNAIQAGRLQVSGIPRRLRVCFPVWLGDTMSCTQLRMRMCHNHIIV